MWEGRYRHCSQIFQGILPNFLKHWQKANCGFVSNLCQSCLRMLFPSMCICERSWYIWRENKKGFIGIKWSLCYKITSFNYVLFTTEFSYAIYNLFRTFFLTRWQDFGWNLIKETHEDGLWEKMHVWLSSANWWCMSKQSS